MNSTYVNFDKQLNKIDNHYNGKCFHIEVPRTIKNRDQLETYLDIRDFELVKSWCDEQGMELYNNNNEFPYENPLIRKKPDFI